MGRMRSPNFPAIPLEESLNAAKVIWDKNRKAAIPREAAAKDLGYSGLTGRSMQVLGALNQYGLVEITAKGLTRVTQLAENAFIGFPEEIKRLAVTEASRSPSLFREIYDRFDGHVPGENAIRSFLFQRGFTNDGVEKALKSFNASNRYAEMYGVSESSGPVAVPVPESPSTNGVVEDDDMQIEDLPRAAAKPREPEKSPKPTFAEDGPLDYNLSTSGIRLTGMTNSANDLKAFIAKLGLLVGLLPDDAAD